MDEREGAGESMAVVARRGILLNPKLTLFFFAFLPQFLATPLTLFDPRLVGLGAVFTAGSSARWARC